MVIFKIVQIILIVIGLFWIFGFLFLNDFSVPTESIKKFKKILLIYPHPDDEVLTAGGVMAENKNATLLILTKGERGTSDAHLDLSLKQVRTNEEQKSSKILGVKKLIQMDLGDGQLGKQREIITKTIREVVKEEKPDLIITYDLSGFYGHPDHMVVSEVITELVKKEFQNTELWYPTVPKRVYGLLKIPEEMAKDKNFKNKRTYPTLKVFVGLNVIKKIQAVAAHKSQSLPFQPGLPIPIPTWFFHSMTVFEYFYKVV